MAFLTFFVLLFVSSPQPIINLTVANSFSEALWQFRSLDILLQMLIILAGTFSILTLVKERDKK